MNASDLSTDYLGLKLSSPLVATAPSRSHTLDEAHRVEDAGAAAIIMHPLFEEGLKQEEEATARFLIHPEIGHAEAHSFLPFHADYRHGRERHLQQLADLKESLGIPVIATLKGISPAGWMEHAQALEQAGADALELHACYLAIEAEETITQVEERYLALVRMLHARVSIPIALNFPPWFSALPHFAGRLETEGAAGIVLSPPLHEPDIDLDTLRLTSRTWVRPGTLTSIRWIGLLHGRLSLSLAGGEDVGSAAASLKLLLAGADVVRPQGDARTLARMHSGIHAWMEEHGFQSVNEFRGLLSQRHAADPAAYGHPNCQLLG